MDMLCRRPAVSVLGEVAVGKPWISTKRDRESKKYARLHAALRAEVAQSKQPEPDKASVKRQRSADFRQRGE